MHEPANSHLANSGRHAHGGNLIHLTLIWSRPEPPVDSQEIAGQELWTVKKVDNQETPVCASGASHCAVAAASAGSIAAFSVCGGAFGMRRTVRTVMSSS